MPGISRDRTGCRLLFDVANMYANARNLGLDARELLGSFPLDRLAYVHVAGGEESGGLYHDTHAHPVPAPVYELLAALCALVEPPGVLLERDDRYPSDAELAAELEGIRGVLGNMRTSRGRPDSTQQRTPVRNT